MIIDGLTDEDTVRYVRGMDCEESIIVEQEYVEGGMNVTLFASFAPISVCYLLASL